MTNLLEILVDFIRSYVAVFFLRVEKLTTSKEWRFQLSDIGFYQSLHISGLFATFA